jgi:purine-cytosine permease-like protein
MNRTQKSALYGVLLSLLLAGVIVFDFLDTRVGWPVMLLVAIIWGGLLLGPVYFLGRKRQPPGADMDERDRQIIRKALLAAFALLAVMSGAAFVAAFLALGARSTMAVTMDEVSAVVYFLLVIFALVLSLAVLVQYGWRGADEQ